MLLQNRSTMAGSALLLTIVGLSVSVPKCPMWREIAPCTCKQESQITSIKCFSRNYTYDQISEKFQGHFNPANRVHLSIGFADLKDLNYRAFKDLNMTIEHLRLNHDTIGLPINEESFDGLSQVKYFSLADSVLNDVPEQLWKKMPNIATLDLGRTHIHSVTSTNFQGLDSLAYLLLPGNQISRMDKDSIPSHLSTLHLGRNHIKILNGTLLNLPNLNWLLVNANQLETLENELPVVAPNLQMIHAAHNFLDKLPQQLKTYPNLDTLFLNNNKLTSLDGALSKSRKLLRLVLENNYINTICAEDFAETEMLENLILSHNELTTLNNSLLNLKNLKYLNVTFNRLTEFSFQDVVGLEELGNIDLSYNQISKIQGPAAAFQNLVEWNIQLLELKLDHNLLETLNGALSGLPYLIKLDLSFNQIKSISPDDLIGLDQLQFLDISYNQLTTLEEMSKTFLPKLSELIASHNNLTILERDFHGLPVLCQANFEHNQIIALGRDLVAKTRCQIDTGVYEGTWDTLKINLQDNPILCDAALPEIMSLMEINHTRIYGTTKSCLTLSEQPTTSKPNDFLGYIPELPLPPSVEDPSPIQVEKKPDTIPAFPVFDSKPLPLLNVNNLPFPPEVELTRNEQYTVATEETPSNHLEPLALKTPENDVPINSNISEEANVKVEVSGEKAPNVPVETPPPSAVEIFTEPMPTPLPLQASGLEPNSTIPMTQTTELLDKNTEEPRKP
ncbi:unnamed protein product [Brassicogethes aeneus]|uniref:Uncharacterized protein n=1 Tax=Brassicogethes aeneus TaxID=1431903 RepID=A0A9P0FBR6_BRAAE|nr:unnamed protein product [Brassicogethes aeneus]